MFALTPGVIVTPAAAAFCSNKSREACTVVTVMLPELSIHKPIFAPLGKTLAPIKSHQSEVPETVPPEFLETLAWNVVPAESSLIKAVGISREEFTPLGVERVL